MYYITSSLKSTVPKLVSPNSKGLWDQELKGETFDSRKFSLKKYLPGIVLFMQDSPLSNLLYISSNLHRINSFSPLKMKNATKERVFCYKIVILFTTNLQGNKMKEEREGNILIPISTIDVLLREQQTGYEEKEWPSSK